MHAMEAGIHVTGVLRSRPSAALMQSTHLSLSSLLFPSLSHLCRMANMLVESYKAGKSAE